MDLVENLVCCMETYSTYICTGILLGNSLKVLFRLKKRFGGNYVRLKIDFGENFAQVLWF